MKFRVWTFNTSESVSLMTDWMTRAQCEKFIVDRWGFWPGFAVVSTAKTEATFRKFNRF